MRYALRSLLSLLIVLAGAGCSPQDADSGPPPASAEPGSPSTTLAMSVEDSKPTTDTAELPTSETSEEPAVEAEPQLDAQGRHSVYSGVYSEEQAARGMAIQEEHCSACHTPDDWGGGSVLTGFTGMSAYDLVNRLRETMPMDEPGRLSMQEYTDVASFIFQLNGAPAGPEELPADAGELARVRLEYRRR